VKTAEIVIIGGGITGACAAYRLAERGANNVVLVEQRHIASGPTGRSSRIVRQHYAIETLAAMARDSVKVFQDFADQVGLAMRGSCRPALCSPHRQRGYRDDPVRSKYPADLREAIETAA